MRKSMENIKRNNTRGITLVALVVTIVVLLILAGITITYVFGDNSIFKKASDAKEQMAIATAREKLELVLGDALMKKYESGLTETELDNKIAEVGELIPKEGENSNNQQVIVDGSIFEIDRSVPKIIDYIGPADGVIITATIKGLSNGWMKPDEVANISIKGTIKTYSGGNITNVSATKGETPISDFSINNEGQYEITGITSATIIVITAKDSNNKENSKILPIEIKIDNIAPTVDNIDISESKGVTIKFKATGTDKESGIKQFNYMITSTQDTTLEKIPTDKRTGTLKQGETVEIELITTGGINQTTYTISVTATDNCDNTTNISTTQNIIIEKFIPVTKISINKGDVYLGVQDTENITVTVEPTNATNKEIQLISSNPQIAEISSEGTITGKSYGTVTITVQSMQNKNITCSVTVKVGEKLDLNTVPITNENPTGLVSRNPFKLSAPNYGNSTSCVIPLGSRCLRSLC